MLMLPIFVTSALHTSQSNQDFELLIQGFTGYQRFGAGPTPPGYNVTSQGTITWDVMWYSQPVFRLLYKGTSPVKILSLQIWQETQKNGITWNITAPISISPPLGMLNSGGYFEFQVDESFFGGTSLPTDVIYAAVQIENQDELVLLTINFDFLSFLSTWQPHSNLNYSTDFPFLFLILIPCGITIWIRRKIIQERH
jgi:hypothetical protein